MNIVDRLSMSDGLCSCGVCAMGTLLSHMDDRQRLGLSRLIDSPRSVLVALFPYLTGALSGNLSLYARGRDYHAVIADRLGAAIEAFQAEYPENHFVVLADDSPLPEVYAAACAGLGCIGDNGLLIHPDYGSYVFIGTILTDLRFACACDRCGVSIPPSDSHCLHLRCMPPCLPGRAGQRTLSVRAHPTGRRALPRKGRARAANTRSSGAATCAAGLPENQHAHRPTIPPFEQSPIDALDADVDGLTRRQFSEKYPDRAFTWRGPAPLRRNLDSEKRRPHKSTPLYDALRALYAKHTARFHMPGHKGKDVLPDFGPIFAIDFTEIYGTGNLYEPEKAQSGKPRNRPRSIYHAPDCHFLTGGSSQGVVAPCWARLRRRSDSGCLTAPATKAHACAPRLPCRISCSPTFVFPEAVSRSACPSLLCRRSDP